MAGWIKMPLGMEVGLGPGHIVLDGDHVTPPKKDAQPPQYKYKYKYRPICNAPISPSKKTESEAEFLAHVYCDQTAGWIKMTLGTEVGLGPCHVALDGDPAPPQGHRPQFSAHVC